MDLNELVEAGKIDLSKVSDSALSSGMFDGKLYGINIGSNAFCFIQNEKLIKDAGMELLPQDATWEDFEKFCLEYTEKTGKIAVCLPGFDMNVFRIRARSNGQDLYSDDQKSLGFDKQLLADHFAMMKRLHDAGATDNVSVMTTNISNEDRSFAKGEAAMIFDWTDTYTTYDNLLKGEFGGLNLNILPGSASGKGMYIKPSQLFSVPVTSENVDAAAAFINYWINDMDANVFLAGRRGVPINTEAANKVAENLDDTTQRVFNYISNVLPEFSSKIFAPDPAANSEVADEFNKQIQLVLFGQSTPEQAADDLFAFAGEGAEPVRVSRRPRRMSFGGGFPQNQTAPAAQRAAVGSSRAGNHHDGNTMHPAQGEKSSGDRRQPGRLSFYRPLAVRLLCFHPVSHTGVSVSGLHQVRRLWSAGVYWP